MLNHYGSFAGRVNHHDPAAVQQILEYAMDRAADELLTSEQMFGLLTLAHDAIEVLKPA